MKSNDDERVLGARLVPDGARFGAFVTPARPCAVRILDEAGNVLATHPMEARGDGYFEALAPGVGAGALYKLVVDGRELPDPYARFLPHGVHGPAQLQKSEYVFRHPGVTTRLSEQVVYELHVGTFTPEGTYDAARRHLGELAGLGVRTIELMPVAAFAGSRGWGYDGVAHYAPYAPYGSPDDLRRFVDEAHAAGLSVVLDVVYNHFGPSGNYLGAFSDQYFGADNRWGCTLNFACPAMRRYVVENARYWLEEFRFDGLRVDAVHATVDGSSEHVLRELTRAAQELGKRLLFAEDDRNDPATVTSLGFDAVWADDFHHQVRVTLTGEQEGYYASYMPGVRGIADAINGGWLYSGQTSPATGRARGKAALGMVAESLVYCIQNHDQVGNRAFGERLSSSVSLEAYGAASTLLLFLPMTPLLFMGQEWAASTPFLYFTDHEGELGQAIAAGRRDELKAFPAFADPEARALVPDPQALATFESSKLRWEERVTGAHPSVLELYRKLLYLRRSDPVLHHASRECLKAEARRDVLIVRRHLDSDVRVLCVNFGTETAHLSALDLPDRGLLPVLTSHGPLQVDVLPPRCATILAGRSPARGS